MSTKCAHPSLFDTASSRPEASVAWLVLTTRTDQPTRADFDLVADADAAADNDAFKRVKQP